MNKKIMPGIFFLLILFVGCPTPESPRKSGFIAKDDLINIKLEIPGENGVPSWDLLEGSHEMDVFTCTGMGSSVFEKPPYTMGDKTYPQKIYLEKNADGKTFSILSNEVDFAPMMPVTAIVYFPKVGLIKSPADPNKLTVRCLEKGTAFFIEKSLKESAPLPNWDEAFKDLATIEEYRTIWGDNASIRPMESEVISEKYVDSEGTTIDIIVLKLRLDWNLKGTSIHFADGYEGHSAFSYMYQRVHSFSATKDKYWYDKVLDEKTGDFTLKRK